MLKFIQKDFVKNNLNKIFLTKTEVIPIFIGRERELASLKEFYEKDGQEDYFYTATKVGKNRNLELFSKQVVDLLMPGVENISFHTTEAVFDFIDKNIGDEKLVLVIDELPYWAESLPCLT